jgi:hypothetical protein
MLKLGAATEREEEGEEAGMNLHAYHCGPIDFGWELLPTVDQMAEKIAGVEAVAKWKGNATYLEPLPVTEFIKAFEAAKTLARDVGWDGGFSEGPCVFWLPSPCHCINGSNSFQCGFVWKQDDNGSAFIVSPIPLDWLKDEESGVLRYKCADI